MPKIMVCALTWILLFSGVISDETAMLIFFIIIFLIIGEDLT